MELKKYQKQVIADLSAYLALFNEQPTLAAVFAEHLQARYGISVGVNGVPGYQDVVEGVPHVCYKVPTGGGKTLLACASVKPIFDALPPTRKKAVVWLVPSDPILAQTLAALKNPSHPYRQKLNADFSGRVEVYSKEELLAGQNFSPVTVEEQLSIMVLSYDSFRRKTKEGLRAYRENGNLASFSTLGTPDRPIENADENSLFQVINQLNPVVIVDESHNATSVLSHEMLVNFNPSFILDLTATPKKQANIIAYVDALALKNENMVKLPVIAYNRSSQTDVITDAIDLRASLEASAKKQSESGGPYIRPIVLFQAQPKVGEDATTFEKLREKLVKVGIPENQIAIKTANINELKGVDLLNPDCEIRFIITVNALKEGWDCPFAYILASLANKTSQVDVEQILGRILRQPYATKQRNALLNMSYVLTSSNDFTATLASIVTGLNEAGFSKRDYRSIDDKQLDLEGQGVEPTERDVSLTSLQGGEGKEPAEEFLDFDENQIAADLNTRRSTEEADQEPGEDGLTSMLDRAQKKGADYEQEADDAAKRGTNLVPTDLRDAVETIEVNPEFTEDIAKLKLPQFVVKTPESALFSTGDDGYDLLRHQALAADFNLLTKDTGVDLSAADEQMFLIDVKKGSAVPNAVRMNAADQRYMRTHFAKMSVKGQKQNAAEAIYQRLKPINAIKDSDLRTYIARVVEGFGTEALLTYQEQPNAVAQKIRQKINSLLEAHKFKRFYEDIETRRVDVQDTFVLPPVIQPSQASSLIGGSLYKAEGSMNNDEMDFAGRFSGLDNVRWWHRNLERRGFCINGPLNHYPDFMVMTNNGTLVVVEPKGAQLKNDDSKRKLRLGLKWADMAGANFRYYMVFQDGVPPLEGAVNVSKFLRILEQL